MAKIQVKRSNNMSQLFQRIVVVGAGGFVGQRLLDTLKPLAGDVVPIGRAQADLTDDDGAVRLSRLMRDGDAVVFLSAVTPDKSGDLDILAANIKIAETFLAAIRDVALEHVVYLSSDAVYPFQTETITEETATRAENPYAQAHIEREALFRSALGTGLTILRPTLIYGPGDTHSSYGPSRLCKEGLQTGTIHLFGEGEELRDHVFIDDVTGAIKGALVHRPEGPLNVASGDPIHYADLAGVIAQQVDRDVSVIGRDRKQPVTHRRFDISGLRHALPDHVSTQIRDGVTLTLAALRRQTTDPSDSRIVQ